MSDKITEVRLLAVPLVNKYSHTLYFVNKEAQTNYFISKTISHKDDFSYQRKEKVLRYPANVDALYNCNYLMYKNSAFSSKWFYAFITKMEYANDNMTLISFETDVMQTWLFDYEVKPSFIEREHVDNDKIGLHTIPEGLETGDYVENSKNINKSLLETSVIMGCTVDINDLNEQFLAKDKYEAVAGEVYNGIYSGIKYFKMTANEAKKAIKALAETGQSDAIISLFTCPALFVPSFKVTVGEKTYPYSEVVSSEDVVCKNWVSTDDDTENYKPTNINGYVPKNNKLFTYPYCYMLMNNNAGGSAVYKYELFNNPDNNKLCAFNIYSAITPGFSMFIAPRYYNGAEINNVERLQGGKFPVCAWASDVYTNWLTQNAVNIPLSIGTALATTGLAIAGAMMAPATGGASAIATVGAISAGVSGATSIASTLGEIYQHSLQPPQAEGNINSGDVTFSAGILTFTAHQMTIKAEFAKVIDDYFMMYGYKVNRVGVPLKYHRENYWYTKLIDANIVGNIPMDDLQKIKDVYNRGFTYWKNPDNIGDYSVMNRIGVN